MGKIEMWAWILLALALLAGVVIGLNHHNTTVDDCAQRGGIMLKTSANTPVCVRKDILL
jgi:hypothetical protein